MKGWGGKIERPMWSGEVKDFGFRVFYYETKSQKKKWNDIVTIKENRVRSWKRFALGDKKSIINKW